MSTISHAMEPLSPMALTLQALLLVADGPIKQRAFAEVLGHPIADDMYRALFDELKQQARLSAWDVQWVNQGIRLHIKPNQTHAVQAFLDRTPIKPSKTQLEILAILAHLGPSTRTQIETIRGVKVASPTIQTLRGYEWIECTGKLDVPGKPQLWDITDKLIEDLGLLSKAELSDELDKLVQNATGESNRNQLPIFG